VSNTQSLLPLVCYKLFRKRKDGTYGPLFINRKQKLVINEWYKAEKHPTKGYAYRPGWHCCGKPEAPHLSTKGRVWCVVELGSFVQLKRPESQGGTWFLANRIKILQELP
jgi:hypothetical protein